VNTLQAGVLNRERPKLPTPYSQKNVDEVMNLAYRAPAIRGVSRVVLRASVVPAKIYESLLPRLNLARLSNDCYRLPELEEE